MSVIVHPDARVSALAEIEPSARGSRIELQAGVVIDSFVKIKPVGGVGDVVIGENSYINSGCVLYSGNGIRIGRDVLIAANCTLAATNHAFDRSDLPIRLQGFQPSRGGIVIEDNVWIGANSVLLDGTVVETGCVVAAGSVLRGRLKAGHLYGGTPARLIRRRS
ncbi:MAG: acyltransferase [Hyphomicrobiales bacterium]|nr:acyltransferase [Hyphomicrobiales bacterium]